MPRTSLLLPVSSVILLLLGAACDTGALSFSPVTGAGGSGGSANQGAQPQDELIDDFEDGDLAFRLPEGRGYWVAGGDGALVVEEGGADKSARALHVNAASFQAILSPLDANELTSRDYSSCRGMELWAKLDSTSESGSLAITVESASGAASTDLELSTEWQRFELAWGDLLPGGGNQPGREGAGGAAGAVGVAEEAGAAGDGGAGGEGSGAGAAGAMAAPLGSLDPSAIRSFRIRPSPAAAVWVDEIRLRQCTLKPTPPASEPPALGSAGPAGTPVSIHGQLSVVGTQLVDQAGNPVQLKGVSSMWLNWEPSGYAESKEALRWMRDNWKLTVIRAAMGVTPRGAYLADPGTARHQVNTIVENAIELGVYVIIDWHADDALAYRAKACEFFSEMAQKYRDAPNLIYETLNEPLEVDWSRELKPYHQAVVDSIRSRDPDNTVILGTPRWSQLVHAPAVDPVVGENLVYTLHFYACTHGASLRRNAETALTRGVPLFVSEWGATTSDGGMDGLVCDREGRQWLDWMAVHRLSWAAWKLDDCVPDSTCLLASKAPLTGGWTDEWLRGHASMVREYMLKE